MEIKFHDLDDKLVVTRDDEAAVWSDDEKKWIKGDVALARRAMTDGQLIDAAKAKAGWPAADLASIPVPN